MALLVLLLGGVAGADPAKTPYPEWNGGRIQQAGVQLDLESLATYLERLDARSPQRYTVVVVRHTGRGTWATRNYTDELFRRWTAGDLERTRIGHERAVLLVLAHAKKQLSIRTSPALQEQYRLRGQALDTRFVQPHFVPHAKFDRYDLAFRRLIEALEVEIGARRPLVADDAPVVPFEAKAVQGYLREALGSLRKFEGNRRDQEVYRDRLVALERRLDDLIDADEPAGDALREKYRQLRRDTVVLRTEIENRVHVQRGLDKRRKALSAQVNATIRGVYAAERSKEVDLPGLRRDLLQIRRRVESTRGSAVDAEASAHEALDAAERDLAAINEGFDARVAKAVANRPWRPSATLLMVVGGAFLLLFLGVLFRRHRKRKATGLLAQRERSYTRADAALQEADERHRAILRDHTDYRKTPVGRTARIYHEVGNAIRELRRRWAATADGWEPARELIAAQSIFGWRGFDRARAHLKAHPPLEAGPETEARILEPLSALETAHADARRVLTGLRNLAVALEAEIDEIEALGLSPVPHEVPRIEVADLRRDAEARLEADPLGVGSMLADAQPETQRWLATAEGVVAGATRHAELTESADAVAASAAARRAEGFRFLEEGSDPDPHLQHAETHRARGWAALDAGDPAAASSALTAAADATEAAAEAIDAQVEAKAYCASGIPRLREALVGLAALRDATRSHVEVLESGFAPQSWDEVAGVLEVAADTLERGPAEIDLAAHESEADVQLYLQGAARVRETTAALRVTEDGLKRAQSLHDALVALRAVCQEAAARLEERRDRLELWLARETRDRLPANDRFDRGRALCQRAREEAAVERPNWEIVEDVIRRAGAQFDLSEQLAREDIRLAEEAAASMSEARRAVARADGHYGNQVHADLRSVRALLAEGLRALTGRAYEEVLRIAGQAIEDAEDAREEAEAEVHRIRRRERERRQERARKRDGFLASGSRSSGSSTSGLGWSISIPSTRSSSSSSSRRSSGGGGRSSGSSSGTSQSSW